MRLILCSVLLAAGCRNAADSKEAREAHAAKHMVWEQWSAPEPGYVCYRYGYAQSTEVTDRSHIVCFEKPVTNPDKNCECN
jgi:hypothetical protein